MLEFDLGWMVTKEIEAALAALSADPALAGSVGADAAMVVWSAAVDRVLWASRAAEPLRRSIEGPDGRLDLSGTAVARLRDLSGGLAPRTGMRLARLRFAPDPAPYATVACRLLAVGAEDALLTIFMGGAPAILPTGRPERTGPGAAGQQLRGILRFTWSMDRETRFRSVSPALAEVVGRERADVVGRSWSDLLGPAVIDPESTIAGHLATRATWSDETVFWLVGDGGLAVPVDLGGMPVFGKANRFEGFRGFGFCFADEMRDVADIAPARAEPGSLLRQADGRSDALASRDDVRLRAGASAPSGLAGGGVAVPRQPPVPGPAPRSLSQSERGALREIARALGSPAEAAADDRQSDAGPVSGDDPDVTRVLDRLPVGILILAGETPAYANRFVLDFLGHRDLAELDVSRLFAGRSGAALRQDGAAAPVTMVGRSGEVRPAEIRLTSVAWQGRPASLLLIRPPAAPDPGDAPSSLQLEIAARDGRIRELRGILDASGIAAATLDDRARILSITPAAEALFGYAANEIAGEGWTVLLAPESHPDALKAAGSSGPAAGEIEMTARRRDGSTVPVRVRLAPLDTSPDPATAAIFIDLTSAREAESELAAARRAADIAVTRQSDVLARVSHEIRTPLNAILGFAEIMLEERFGPIGNERYGLYLKDIHGSGELVLSLVNDLLDLAKIAAGRAELAFTSLDLNAVLSGSVGLLQPSATRERVVIRTRFAPALPPVAADERAMKQVALNLVANAIRFTDVGGQVIVSTGLSDAGEVVMRVRDTGIGMTPDEIRQALEPFGQVSLAHRPGGTGLGLPLAKALAEANGADFAIESRPRHGTLVEILFPRSRVLAE